MQATSSTEHTRTLSPADATPHSTYTYPPLQCWRHTNMVSSISSLLHKVLKQVLGGSSQLGTRQIGRRIALIQVVGNPLHEVLAPKRAISLVLHDPLHEPLLQMVQDGVGSAGW